MKKLLITIGILCATLLMFAQTDNMATSLSPTSAYSYEGSRSGVQKLKMNVYVLGRVHKPGLYLVPDDTDFITLLALAGGPAEDAKLTKIRVIRPAKQTLGDESEAEIIWINFKKYMETADDQYLATKTTTVRVLDELTGEETENTVYDLRLQPGDTVVVSGTIFYAFSKVADFLSKAAIALSVYKMITTL